MKALHILYRKCLKSDTNFVLALIRLIYIRLIFKKTFLLHQKVIMKGIRNIQAYEKIEIGVEYVGFMHREEKTYLNISGKLIFKGNYKIGRGCRFDVGEDATVIIGKGGYVNCNTSIIIMNKLIIGNDCAISWNCQFLDNDFHTISYANKKEISNSIEIGDHVWIGSGVKIYKGTKILDGCVIASDSVVKKAFDKKNCLIGGNPAKILVENIQWK